MGFLDFLFGKKKDEQSKQTHSSPNIAKPSPKLSTQSAPSLTSIAKGAPFAFEFSSVTIVKQYYNQTSEQIKLSTSVSVKMVRDSVNGEVTVVFKNLSELKSKGILQSNLSINPQFAYSKDNEGNEFDSAEINNSFSAMASGKEYISLFQITNQKGNIVSFLINNLPGDQDFYYLIIMRN